VPELLAARNHRNEVPDQPVVPEGYVDRREDGVLSVDDANIVPRSRWPVHPFVNWILFPYNPMPNSEARFH
jgi:hypothetical protein